MNRRRHCHLQEKDTISIKIQIKQTDTKNQLSDRSGRSRPGKPMDSSQGRNGFLEMHIIGNEGIAHEDGLILATMLSN